METCVSCSGLGNHAGWTLCFGTSENVHLCLSLVYGVIFVFWEPEKGGKQREIGWSCMEFWALLLFFCFLVGTSVYMSQFYDVTFHILYNTRSCFVGLLPSRVLERGRKTRTRTLPVAQKIAKTSPLGSVVGYEQKSVLYPYIVSWSRSERVLSAVWLWRSKAIHLYPFKHFLPFFWNPYALHP